jgi:hypothetical protein
VGVTPTDAAGLAVFVTAAGVRETCGKLQFERTSVRIGTIAIIDGINLRFTVCVEIIIPA